MAHAFRFLPASMIPEEDRFCGNIRPWKLGERRIHTEFNLDAGDGVTLSISGYNSSPTLWGAMFQADGPIACLLEVSTPLRVETVAGEPCQVSKCQTLIAAHKVALRLKQFALDCADRAISQVECLQLHNGGVGCAKIPNSAFNFAVAPNSTLRDLLKMAERVISIVNSEEQGDYADAASMAVWLGVYAARRSKDDRPGISESRWQHAYFELLFGRTFDRPWRSNR
jgi:hypothetical protein